MSKVRNSELAISINVTVQFKLFRRRKVGLPPVTMRYKRLPDKVLSRSIYQGLRTVGGEPNGAELQSKKSRQLRQGITGKEEVKEEQEKEEDEEEKSKVS
ncbi:unnamed protein product [Schistocephalus solidus]|uniref:Uncharacterized protein n=1 Tax=Schistocephalus solidus TaxID=70667 RepID=A0A183TNY9_SCHSO|nr:unnamed protein product [Schistocephalus solidus]